MRYSQTEKMEIIRLVEQSTLPVKRTLAEFGLSRSTFYRWYRRYVEDGFDGLANGSGFDRRFWNRIPDRERQRVVEIALATPELSPREVAFRVTDGLWSTTTMSVSTSHWITSHRPMCTTDVTRKS